MLHHLQSPQGSLYNEYLTELLRSEEKRLHRGDGNDVYRAQGATAILNLLLDLEKDIRQYEKDLLDGRVREIEKEAPNVMV